MNLFKKSVAIACFVFGSSAVAHASIAVVQKDDWKVSISGFVEVDAIVDSKRSYLEQIGAAPVDRSETVAGRAGRTQFSVRNTRLGLEVSAPRIGAWDSRGYFEFDLRGYNAVPSSSSGNTNTEKEFFTSPTLRARLAYAEASTERWSLLAGQAWSIFGWQPYYFNTAGDVVPIAGEAQSRNPQFRVMGTLPASEVTVWQVAAALARPPQRDSQLPAFDAGVRVSFSNRRAGYAGMAGTERTVEPMSFGLSGTVREFTLPRAGGQTGELSYFPGGALAFNAFVPVLAAERDATAAEGTLSVLASATIGRGYGDHFVGWTGNLTPNPAESNLDAGIAGTDTMNNFRLLEMRSFDIQAQLHPSFVPGTWLSGGYGQVYSSNAGLFVPLLNQKVYTRQEATQLGVFHDFTRAWRVALFYVFSRTEYFDGQDNENQRFQLSTWFSF